MTKVKLLSDVEVKLVSSKGGDESVVRAARVSVVGENFVDEGTPFSKRDEGLINYLMKNHHGSPFEHNFMSFYVKAPIFAVREFQRHRIGFSYNEMSGRYSEMLPEFYCPSENRPLVNVGTSARPRFAPGSRYQTQLVRTKVEKDSQSGWDDYQEMLAAGIGKEVARIVLPLNLMTQMYVTCNARSLMNFLSLRTHDEDALIQSSPQYEIELVARQMERRFGEAFPITYQKYQENHRLAP